MNIITVVLIILVVGILLWAVNQFIPLEGTVKKILDAVVLIALIIWLLKAFGIWRYLSHFNV